MPETSAFYRDLGRRVRERRDELRLSQEQLARDVGMTRTSIANLEAGQQRISVETLVGLAAALSVTAAQLLPPPTPAPEVDHLMPSSLSPKVRSWVKMALDKAASTSVGTAT